MKLSRRALINRASGLAAIAVLGRYFSGMRLDPVPDPLLDLAKAETAETYLCMVHIGFPKKLAMSDFLRDRSRWMDSQKFESILSDLRATGKLLKDSYRIDPSETGMTHTYSFRTTDDRAAFVTLVNAHSAVNKSALLSIGYQFDLEYQTISS